MHSHRPWVVDGVRKARDALIDLFAKQRTIAEDDPALGQNGWARRALNAAPDFDLVAAENNPNGSTELVRLKYRRGGMRCLLCSFELLFRHCRPGNGLDGNQSAGRLDRVNDSIGELTYGGTA
jgi:hypothetical protein